MLSVALEEWICEVGQGQGQQSNKELASSMPTKLNMTLTHYREGKIYSKQRNV